MSNIPFEQRLEALFQPAHPVEGLFGPASLTWQLNRETLVYLGGVRALLLQLAHPAVAKGVVRYSRYREDTLGRARRTFATVQTMVFGTPEEARAAAIRVYHLHSMVEGEVRVAGRLRKFRATDPDLLLWVYATLVDSARQALETFGPPRPRRVWEAAYEESKTMARLFGLEEHHLPPTLEAFEAYMETMLQGPVLEVTDEARDIATYLFTGPLWLRAMAPLTRLLAVQMLPRHLAEGFGLPWHPAHARWFGRLQRVVRKGWPLLPAALRYLPAARRAERRVRRACNKDVYRVVRMPGNP